MPLPLLFLLLAAIFVASLALSALWLWTAAKWFTDDPPSFWNASGVYAAILATNLGFDVATRMWANAIVGVLLGVLAVYVAIVNLIAWAFHLEWWRAFVLLIVFQLVGGGVAFSAALLFKALLCEAFVIPTGSMAEALLGDHVAATCPHCGRPLRFGYPERLAREEGLPAGKQVGCPQCGQGFLLPGDAVIRDGDRVVCDKTLFPSRWQIGVYRPPAMPGDQGERALYAGRLVGLPGERIEIFRGDLFANGQPLQKAQGTAEDLWILVHDSAFETAEVNGAKPPPARPEGPFWRSGGEPWLKEGGLLGLAAGGAYVSGGVRFESEIRDQLAYNDVSRRPMHFAPVPDVRVSCRVKNVKPGSTLTFLWSWHNAGVELRVGPASAPAGSRDLIGLPGREIDWKPLSDAGPLVEEEEIVFQVRDGRASCLRGGAAVISADVLPLDLAIARKQADEKDVPALVGLIGSGDGVWLSRVQTWRDVYFTARGEMDFPGLTLQDTISLAGDEFLFLGDNSRASQDSRFFGGVPRKDILGTIRFRYWPPERWHAWQ